MKGRVTFNWVKKALLAAVVSAGLFTTNSYAQQLHAGFMGGPQLTNLESDFGTFKGIVGFNGGGVVDWRVSNKFGLELDALFSQYGATKVYDQPQILHDRTLYYSYRTTDRLSYLQFVLLPKFIIPLGAKPVIPYDKPGDQKLFLSFFAGPYFGLRSGFSSTGKQSGYTVLNAGDTINRFEPTAYTNTTKDADRVAPNDFGFTAGAGINFNMAGGKMILGFDGRYSRSLATIDLGYYQRQTRGVNSANQPVVIKDMANILNTAMAFNVSLKFRILGE